MRRVHLRGQDNIAKRVLIHAAAFNLSLILRQSFLHRGPPPGALSFASPLRPSAV